MSVFLKHKFDEAKKTNPLFSIRSFALKAGVSSGAMTEILHGKRRISSNIVQKISENLSLNPGERAQFVGEIKNSDDSKQGSSTKPTIFLTRRQFQFITEGHHFALVALLDTEGFQNETSWISQRLGISETQVELAIHRLVQARILRIEDGVLKKDNLTFSTSDDVVDSFVALSHVDSLKSARKSVLNDPVELRDFTQFCIPTDPNLLPQVKERIRSFQDDIEKMMKDSKTTEVYKLAIQFFPMTKSSSGNKK